MWGRGRRGYLLSWMMGAGGCGMAAGSGFFPSLVPSAPALQPFRHPVGVLLQHEAAIAGVPAGLAANGARPRARDAGLVACRSTNWSPSQDRLARSFADMDGFPRSESLKRPRSWKAGKARVRGDERRSIRALSRIKSKLKQLVLGAGCSTA